MNYDKFHVIAMVSNPRDFQSRYRNYEIFEEDIVRKGAQLWTVELATGARAHRITNSRTGRHIQLWQTALEGELWHKEQLVNIALQFLTRDCPDWRYVAWVDADCKFEADALDKTVEALQTYDLVQMWSHLINFDPEGHTQGAVAKSFMYCYQNDIQVKLNTGYLHGGAPGLAWAGRREALNKIGCALSSGPLLDFAILGSGDRNMACALVGKIERSLTDRFHPNYLKWMERYQNVTDRVIRRNVGYVANTVRHLWHGNKEDRGYVSRWEILVRNEFDPETDLTRDTSGLWRLVVESPRQICLRDDIRKYFRSRKEDATTIDKTPEKKNEKHLLHSHPQKLGPKVPGQ